MATTSEIKKLIEDLNKGSEKAFESIFQIYSPRVLAFAMSLLNEREEAEEVVQDIFLSLWKKRQKLSSNGSLESYLLTATKNSVLNILRKADYHKGYVNHQLKHASITESPIQGLQHKELEDIFIRSIEELSPRKRELYSLSRLKEFTYKEISELLGISIKTVQHQVGAASLEVRNKVGSLWLV